MHSIAAQEIGELSRRPTVFIRFVLSEVDEDSHRRTGVLVAAHRLRDSDELDEHERARLTRLLAWFNEHLRVPPPLSRPGNHRALSWFKPNATKPVSRMWEVVHLLRAHGLLVDVLKTDDPGSVLYEDKWQVVAKPPRGRRLPW